MRHRDFAPLLVLIAVSLGVANEITALAALVYLWARIAHWIVYVLAIPWLRTLAFVVGAVCQVMIAVQILT